MENAQNDLDEINESYLKEMESNSKLFDEKMQKLNRLMEKNNFSKNNQGLFPDIQKDIGKGTILEKNENKIETTENKDDIKIEENDNNTDIIDYGDNIEDITNEKQQNNNILNKDLNEINYINNEIKPNINYVNIEKNENNHIEDKGYNINNNQNKKNSGIISTYLPNLKKESEQIEDLNDIISNNKNIELYRQIEQLKNEIQYKNYIIDDLKMQLKKKKSKDEVNIVNNDLEKLLKELDSKNIYIDKMEKDIKTYKCKTDNLVIENKRLCEENDKHIEQIEYLKASLDDIKIETLDNNQKVKDLGLTNKKLNKDYLVLEDNFAKIKEENENLKSLIEEQKATIFNYKKELDLYSDKKNKNNKKNNHVIFGDYNTNYNYNYENIKKRDISNDNKKYIQKNINYLDTSHSSKQEEKNYQGNKYDYKEEMTKYYFNNIKDNNFNKTQRSTYNLKKNEYFGNTDGEKYTYNPNNYKRNIKKNNNDNEFVLTFLNAERNIQLKKGELNYLENYLSSLLNQRAKLENDLSDIPDNPRTLTDVKNRNSIQDKINQNDKEISITKDKLKKIRGY